MAGHLVSSVFDSINRGITRRRGGSKPGKKKKTGTSLKLRAVPAVFSGGSGLSVTGSF